MWRVRQSWATNETNIRALAPSYSRGLSVLPSHVLYCTDGGCFHGAAPTWSLHCHRRRDDLRWSWWWWWYGQWLQHQLSAATSRPGSVCCCSQRKAIRLRVCLCVCLQSALAGGWPPGDTADCASTVKPAATAPAHHQCASFRFRVPVPVSRRSG